MCMYSPAFSRCREQSHLCRIARQSQPLNSHAVPGAKCVATFKTQKTWIYFISITVCFLQVKVWNQIRSDQWDLVAKCDELYDFAESIDAKLSEKSWMYFWWYLTIVNYILLQSYFGVWGNRKHVLNILSNKTNHQRILLKLKYVGQHFRLNDIFISCSQFTLKRPFYPLCSFFLKMMSRQIKGDALKNTLNGNHHHPLPSFFLQLPSYAHLTCEPSHSFIHANLSLSRGYLHNAAAGRR